MGATNKLCGALAYGQTKHPLSTNNKNISKFGSSGFLGFFLGGEAVKGEESNLSVLREVHLI